MTKAHASSRARDFHFQFLALAIMYLIGSDLYPANGTYYKRSIFAYMATSPNDSKPKVCVLPR